MVEASHIKVLHVASGDLWAGAEAQLFTLATTLQHEQSVSVFVVLLNYGILEQRLCEAGVDVTVFDESELNGFQILHQLIRKFKEIKPDVIHTHRIKENILGSIAARLCGNIPNLRTAHGAPEHRPPWYHIPKHIILLLDRFCGHRLQRKIIAVSNDLAGILKKDFPAERIEVIENGIDPASFARSVKHAKSASTSSARPFNIGIAGRLAPVKRVDLFIKAAAELLNTHPELNISFHIYGDGQLRTDLETLTRKLEAVNAVHFEGNCEDMQQALANMDALLITSDHEGLPMILLEAMVLKTPIIAHAVGGIPVLLDHGKCGVLVSNHQPAAYAEAVNFLINNPESREKIINCAFNRVTDCYSNEQNANAYLAVYNGLTP